MRNSKLSRCPKCGGRLRKRKKYRPGIVLDPFVGSGTTCQVAAQLRRDYMGVEIKKEYIEMAEKRILTAETGLTKEDIKAGQMALWSKEK